jgi:hypothetical protein
MWVRRSLIHYTRILRYIKPDFVHVFVDGHVAEQGGLRGAEEVRDGDAGDLDRVLHGQEQAGLGPLVDRHVEDLAAVEQDAAAVDVVARVTGDRVGQG